MKLTNSHNMKRKSGMTLIELTVVIIVLLALIAVLFVGAKAYLKGADKTACIMNQRNIQQACRSFFNLNPSGTLTAIGDLVGADKYFGVTPKCKGTAYALTSTSRDTAAGTRFASCPVTTTATDHTPEGLDNW